MRSTIGFGFFCRNSLVLYRYMDASKLTQMKMESANTFKSNWKPRDASEVTLRNQSIGNTYNNNNSHQGPVIECCANPLTSNFTTDYTQDAVNLRNAGCALFTDSNWDKSGGVTLKNCTEMSTIGFRPLNPVLGNWKCLPNSDGGHQVTPSCCNINPAYTGVYNQRPLGK